MALNGSIVCASSRDMYQVILSWPFLSIVLGGIAVLATGNPDTLPHFSHPGYTAAFYCLGAALILLVYVPYLTLVVRLTRRAGSRPVLPLIVSGPLFLIAALTTGALLREMSGSDKPMREVLQWQLYLRVLIVAHTIETLAWFWLLPAVRARRLAEAGRTVTLAGRRFDLSEIMRVKAAEHFLELHTVTGIMIVRERIGTFLEQLNEEDGVQCHRSHWLARAHIGACEGAVIRMRDGVEVPVARGRAADVADWLAQYGPEPQAEETAPGLGARMRDLAAAKF